jgi:hypothetical protein
MNKQIRFLYKNSWHKQLKACMVFLFILLVSIPSYSQFDTEKYMKPMTATLTEDIFYPKFYKETDPITLNNILNEFKSRYEFFFGISSESRQSACFKVQKRANETLAKLRKKNKKIPYKWADNELLFSEESPVYQASNRVLTKADEKCQFISYGDLNASGGVFCTYHGPDPESEFYRNYSHKFIKARPFITAYDITEILIFLPFLMVVPISWLIMKKFL